MAQLGTDYPAAIAFNRFGLGGRPDDTLPTDPKVWLMRQLLGPDPMPQTGLKTRAQCMREMNTWANTQPGSLAQQAAVAAILATFDAEVQAQLAFAVTTTAPFRERLVWFWANHFALLTSGYGAAVTAGVFVREAIRPHVTGNFTNMLLAVMQHPAMMYSLDNMASIGPDSQFAQFYLKQKGVQLGFNENLARECLELHTLGVNGGYTQADVDALANLLTGWTVVTSDPKGFYFDPTKHEPASQTLLGTVYGTAFSDGIAALQALAQNPATYAHLASELVQHFVSDTPDPNDVATVQTALTNSNGDLTQAYAALIGLPSAWQQTLIKFRTPRDHAIAVLRAVNTTASTMPADIDATLGKLGEQTWGPPFPNGWSDLTADWLCPAQMVLRADWSGQFSAGISGLDPFSVAGSSVGPFLAQLTQSLMQQLSNPADQFTLLFCSPEFQRR